MSMINPSASINDLMTKKTSLFLKWENVVIGKIGGDYSVEFLRSDYNAVTLSTIGKTSKWTREQFKLFIEDRIVSQSRRDIATILARLALQEYDSMEIAKRTRAFNLRDRFWVAYSEHEDYETTFTSIFVEMFSNLGQRDGDVIASPNGQNIKYYAIRDGRVGIVKKQLHPKSFDAVNEVVAYRLAQLFNISCCPAYIHGDTRVFSEYRYDFNSQYLIHARRFTSAVLDSNTYFDFVNEYFPKHREGIQNMLIFDFILNQDDRHMSNWSIMFSSNQEEAMYPLYDNGRCLFHDSSDETLSGLKDSPEQYVNSIGLVGTYMDIVDIIKEERRLSFSATDDELLSCFWGLPMYDANAINTRFAWLKFALDYLKR